MNVEPYLALIPLSQSDQLLRGWGYDLLRENFSIVQQLPVTNSPVVELATGTGRMCATLSCIFPMIISGDISVDDIPRVHQRLLKQFADRVHFMQLDMENLPFRSESISTLVCMNTLHEVSHPQLCLQEMIRVMNPKGTLVIGDFNQTGFDIMQRIHEIVYQNDHQEGSISTDEIEKILTASFHSFRSVTTPLNITYFASDKR
jgi:ubiquinone/menaquinone biosynthesis C-methylase UbiE